MNTQLGGLLVKWLTHDFASPIATVLTASELLSGTPDAEINGLVLDGARRLGARLRIIRAALAPGDSPVGGKALEKLVREGLDSTPVTWARSASDTDGSQAAIIAGAALLLADLRRGQALTVTDTDVRWNEPAALPEGVTAALAGGEPADTRAAIAAMLAAAAARAGFVLTATADGIAWS